MHRNPVMWIWICHLQLKAWAHFYSNVWTQAGPEAFRVSSLFCEITTRHGKDASKVTYHIPVQAVCQKMPKVQLNSRARSPGQDHSDPCFDYLAFWSSSPSCIFCSYYIIHALLLYQGFDVSCVLLTSVNCLWRSQRYRWPWTVELNLDGPDHLILSVRAIPFKNILHHFFPRIYMTYHLVKNWLFPSINCSAPRYTMYTTCALLSGKRCWNYGNTYW